MALPRRDINTLSDSELGDYIHAIDVLRRRSQANPDDETGFDFQAGLHNDVFIGPCEHGSDLFLPWHRAHLHYFEKLLQEADTPRTSNVTIPYWDWIHPQPTGKFPPAFDRQGLSEPGRNLNPQPLPPDTREIVTTETQWKRFGGFPQGDPEGNFGRLERGPHNFMHPKFIGGKMADPATAAEDPIYFSFHCFIDLLWAEWQRRNGMPAPTSPDADLRGFDQQPQHKVADFQDTEQLDYVYELTDQLEQAFAAPVAAAPPPAPPERVAILPLSPVFRRGIAAELQDTERLQFQLAAPPEEARALTARLNQVKVPQKGSYMLRAFVHPSDVQIEVSSEEFGQEFEVGYAVLWRSHTGDGHGLGAAGGHAHHPSSAIIRFDASRALAAEAPPSEHLLTLHYSSADVEEKPEVVEEVEFEDVVMEVYA